MMNVDTIFVLPATKVAEVISIAFLAMTILTCKAP
jgi:hypothetical protein